MMEPWQQSKMVDNIFKFKIDWNLMIFEFCCKSLFCMAEPWQPILLFLLMADIQYGR